MKSAAFALLVLPALLSAQDEVVFRSDVSLVRVDVQVLDRSNRAVTGLQAEDFVLREEGKERQIRNFANEDMPVDVVFLIDVSGSMRPHVQRLADAAESAMTVLGNNDRVALMVFDRMTRVRSGFVPHRQTMREMNALLDQEQFNGGTDITRALLDAARYVERNARKEARRAIVILTDDRTEFDRDEARVGRELVRADAVLMALLAPDAMGGRWSQYPGQTPGGSRGGGGWPSVIFGPPMGGGGYPRRGGGYPGGGGRSRPQIGNNTRSAGTAEIARASGGDSLPVDDASALETTLSRIRQRYALYFLVPEGAKAGEERRIDISLASAAARRYSGAELRYRREYLSPGSGSSPSEVTANEPATVSQTSSSASSPDAAPPRMRRRPVSDGTGSGPKGPNPDVGVAAGSQEAAAAPAAAEPTTDSEPKSTGGGWRRVKPGEKP